MKLKDVNHINDLRRLGLPLNKVLIVGSGTMALFGLKKNDDLDLWVTRDIMNRIKKDSRFMKSSNPDIYETKNGIIEAFEKFVCVKERVEDYLKRAVIIYGFHFMSLNDLLNWKKCMGRPKDLQHIKMIKNYKKNNVVENYLNILNNLT
jgi:hypothetical protein